MKTENIYLMDFFLKIMASGTGLSSLGVPGLPWHTQILADQLTLFQPGGKDYAHLITTGTPGCSDLPTALLRYGNLYGRVDKLNSKMQTKLICTL